MIDPQAVPLVTMAQELAAKATFIEYPATRTS